MRDEIIKKIQEIESTEDVKVLFACESGSRAWGFPSPDSDYDVRMVYARPMDWYLSIYGGRDVIETPLVDNFDVGGWDLKKTLTLIHKSNAVVWEWLQSPTIYLEQEDFRTSLLELAKDYYSPKSAFHHYLSMASKVMEELGKDSKIKLKKVFYVLRPILAARWIAQGLGIPPMDLESLMKPDYVSSVQVAEIRNLVEMKATLNESHMMERSSEIDEILKSNFAYCESKTESIPTNKGQVEPLDRFFKKVIKSWK